MSNLLPRKYNNPVVISLGVTLLAAVVVIVFLVLKPTLKAQPHQCHHETQSRETNSEPEAASETFIPTGKPALVMFYGQWCGHSRNMLPAWNAVKKSLEETGQIDALDFEDSRDKSEILKASKLPGFRGFPDIRFYPEGYPEGPAIAYSGDRSEESLLKFAYTSGTQA